jgi:hypothetical protein
MRVADKTCVFQQHQSHSHLFVRRIVEVQTYRTKGRVGVIVDTRGKRDAGAALRRGVLAMDVVAQVVRHCCDRVMPKSARIVGRLEMQLT